jgi:hypothetical protein
MLAKWKSASNEWGQLARSNYGCTLATHAEDL